MIPRLVYCSFSGSLGNKLRLWSAACRISFKVRLFYLFWVECICITVGFPLFYLLKTSTFAVPPVYFLQPSQLSRYRPQTVCTLHIHRLIFDIHFLTRRLLLLVMRRRRNISRGSSLCASPITLLYWFCCDRLHLLHEFLGTRNVQCSRWNKSTLVLRDKRVFIIKIGNRTLNFIWKNKRYSVSAPYLITRFIHMLSEIMSRLTASV